MKNDINSLEDVQKLVDDFYSKIRKDNLLGDVFNAVIQDRWPEHLDKMYRFWETVLLNEHTYYGSPFPPHAQLPVKKEHFNRWLSLFFETIDSHFSGLNADKAKMQGQRMAEMFLTKINYYKDNNIKPLV